MEFNTHSNGLDIDVHVGSDDKRIKILVAITNTTDTNITLESPMGTWCRTNLINMDYMVNVLESEFSAAAFSYWTIEPNKTITSYFETETPEEAKESVEGLSIETTTDISEDCKSNAYIPNVSLSENMDTLFSVNVNITLDKIDLDDTITLEFKPEQLSDIENVTNDYTLQEGSFHGMSKVNT